MTRGRVCLLLLVLCLAPACGSTESGNPEATPHGTAPSGAPAGPPTPTGPAATGFPPAGTTLGPGVQPSATGIPEPVATPAPTAVAPSGVAPTATSPEPGATVPVPSVDVGADAGPDTPSEIDGGT
jgi:hypothetical protein